MNLFYDHNIFQQTYGGISRYFTELILRFLEKEDVDVHLFMGLFLNRYGLDHMKDRFRTYWGYPVPRVRFTGRLRQWFNQALGTCFFRS